MNVKFQNVTYRRKKFSLKNLSFEIREGYLTALIGKNGAGKTTLFHLLLDKKAHYEGTILADGANWQQNLVDRMNQIGFISDERNFFMELTGQENAMMLQWLYEKFSLDIFMEKMDRMGLSVHKRLGNLSRGEYIKYQLAFAMAHHTRLYLLDEATAGMDLIFKKEFFQILHELLTDEHCTIFMSTHIQEDISKHMDYMIQLEDGYVVSESEVGSGGQEICGIKI